MKKNSSYSWVVLLAFFMVAGVSQMLWLNLAPLISQLQTMYDITAMEASLLLSVFPLLYVILSMHSGSLVDHKGYKFSIGLGAILSAVGACVRIYDQSYAVLMIAQIIMAIGQPYILNGISKLVADWFDKDKIALATGLGTVGMFVGMALGLGLTPALVASMGYQGAMMVFAAIAVVAAILFMLLAKETEEENNFLSSTGGWADIKLILKNKNFVAISLVSFFAQGYFIGFTTWLEPILGKQAVSIEDAGLVGALLIVGGIFGAIIIPAISDKMKNRKIFLILAAIASAALTYPLCSMSDLNILFALGFLLGFFFLPGYAILLAMSEEEIGPERAGAATAFLMMAGNVGGVLVIPAMEMIKGEADWMKAVYLAIGLLVVGGLFGIFSVSETYHKKSA